MQQVELNIRGDVKVLRLNHGDRVIVVFDGRPSRTTIVGVREQLQKLFPLNEVLVMGGVRDIYVQPHGSDQPRHA